MSQQPEQPTIKPCPACGGRRVAAPIYGEGSLGRYALGGRSRMHVSDLTALACTNCGQVTLYVDDMEALRNALEKHPKGFKY